MKAILKVIRCDQHSFRLGVHLPVIDLSEAERVRMIIGDHAFECKLNYARNYGSFIHKDIGEWIKQNEWGHDSRQPMTLLIFDFDREGNDYTFTYRGKSIYKKKSGQRKYSREGTSQFVAFDGRQEMEEMVRTR